MLRDFKKFTSNQTRWHKVFRSRRVFSRPRKTFLISTVINASSEVNSVLSTNWNVLHGADPIYNEYPDLPDSLRQQINEALLCYLSQPPSVCNAQLSQTIAGLIAAINALFEADYAIRFRDFSFVPPLNKSNQH